MSNLGEYQNFPDKTSPCNAVQHPERSPMREESQVQQLQTETDTTPNFNSLDLFPTPPEIPRTPIRTFVPPIPALFPGRSEENDLGIGMAITQSDRQRREAGQNATNAAYLNRVYVEYMLPPYFFDPRITPPSPTPMKPRVNGRKSLGVRGNEIEDDGAASAANGGSSAGESDARKMK
ncbi:hypothetical protein VKT23_008276 [Stygiomarasmius scandens]|uniref:Uncharacterized protein n=1 Tax=Marasmiellus scandens TaxID=2682957 RepID=A0ABR1JIN7_9AGAR